MNTPDPLIAQHAIHWEICKQTYRSEFEKSSFLTVGGITWELILAEEETVVYQSEEQVIVGFRGTVVKKDIIDDLKLANAANGTCNFPRREPAILLVEELLKENPELIVQLTGHSLGGAIARCTGNALNLGVVTFNAAAPPSNPVVSNANQVDYHIVFDIISAWQHPNTIRIDKGYRPKRSRSIVPFRWMRQAMGPIEESHSLSNFSAERVGKIISAKEEDEMIQKWYKSLPFILQGFLDFYLMRLSNFKNASIPNIIPN